MDLNKNETDLLKRICQSYIKTKEMVTLAENIDVRSSANIQINKEFRDALSHIIRIFSDQLLNNSEKKKSEGSLYYESNLDKALGHIYRAGYDAIDGVTISLREALNKTKSFPISIRTQAVPNFAEKISRLDNYHKKIVNYKNNKDIGNNSSDLFNECLEELSKIENEAQEIEKAIPIMEELFLEKTKDKKFTWRQSIIISGISLLLGTIIGLLLK